MDNIGKEEAAPAKSSGEKAVVWLNITNALDNWTVKIIDAETRHSKSLDFRQIIEESLRRQQQDGFLTHYDLADVWLATS